MKKRNLGFDVIRIVAILCVLYNHREAFSYYTIVPTGSVRYCLLVSLSVISRCGPPLFFMISGVLLLDKEESFSTIIKHRLLRIIIAMLVLSIYAKLFWPVAKGLSVFSIFATRLNWYLYAYCGYLLMLPILRIIAKNITIKQAKYFLLITIIVYSIEGVFIPLGVGENFTNSLTLFGATWGSNCWQLTLPLAANLIFKIYRDKENDVEKKKIVACLALGSLLTCLISIALMNYDSVKNDSINCEQILQHAVLFPSFFLLLEVWAKFETIDIKNNNFVYFIQEVSGATFGIFLVETHTTLSQIIFEKVCSLEVYVGRYMCSIISIMCTFILLTIVMCLLRKVPIIRKVL